MIRRPGNVSKDLRVREFGTVGRKEGNLRRSVSLPARRAGGRGPGRIYNFPMKKTPEGK
jgi:hypothetical protein